MHLEQIGDHKPHAVCLQRLTVGRASNPGGLRNSCWAPRSPTIQVALVPLGALWGAAPARALAVPAFLCPSTAWPLAHVFLEVSPKDAICEQMWLGW